MNFLSKKFILIGVLIIVGLIAVFIFPDKKTDEASELETFFEPEVFNETSPVERREKLASESEYKSANYKFSLYYPNNLQVQQFYDGGGASTIVFQNPDAGLGFQIFIAPFSGSQITEERFRQDVPSGVRKELREVTVGGVSAASFYSVDALLGETAEVWFIHGGFLFEVMAPKILALWLSSIIETWLFL